jgi:hypothetical protein
MMRAFSFQDLPAGTYRIEVIPPLGLSTWERNSGKVYDVDIGLRGASGCPVNLTFSADGRIKGKVTPLAWESTAKIFVSKCRQFVREACVRFVPLCG